MAACRKLFLSFLMQIHPPTFVKNNAAFSTSPFGESAASVFFTKQPAPLFWSKILKFPRCWFQRIVIASAEIFTWPNIRLKHLCKIFSQSVYAGCSKDRTSQHSDSRSLPQHPFVTGLRCWSSLIQLRDSAGFTPDFPIKPRIINPTSTQFQIFIFCFQCTCHYRSSTFDRKHWCRHPSGTTLKGLSWVEFAGYD